MNQTLQLKELEIGYQKKSQTFSVAQNINVELKSGELVCLMGPNGAGKSTLIRTISGNQKPLSGKVILSGKNIRDYSAKGLSKKLSIVLTERVQAGMLTAYEVVALGRYPHINWTGKLDKKDHEIIERSIEMASASGLANRLLSELSDGERQKIMVARALAQEPEIMILDAVTAFLDLPRRIEIMHLFKDLAYRTNTAILLSTHDMDLALRNADCLWLMPKNGLFQYGAPEDLILNGSLENAFASEGVQFSKITGAFESINPAKYTAAIIGNGVLLSLTTKALNRIGFTIEDDAQLKINVFDRGGDELWEVQEKESIHTFNSIYALIQYLKTKFIN